MNLILHMFMLCHNHHEKLRKIMEMSYFYLKILPFYWKYKKVYEEIYVPFNFSVSIFTIS